MSSTEKQLAVRESHVDLGERHVVQLASTGRPATLTVRGPEGRPGLELEIALGPEGPIVRLKKASALAEDAHVATLFDLRGLQSAAPDQDRMSLLWAGDALLDLPFDLAQLQNLEHAVLWT